MSARSALDRLTRPPAASDDRVREPRALPSRWSRWLWGLVVASVVAGVGSRFLGAGVVALWCFTVAAVMVAVLLPLPYAVVSPLYTGIAGWLVNMVPFVVLAAWTAVVVRWGLRLVRERRMPRGGRWIWLPIGLVAWTALGVTVVSSLDLKHFLLLLGIQVLSSGVLLAVVDSLWRLEDRTAIAAGLLGFVVACSLAVLLQWFGVNIQALQDRSVATTVEAAYGVDAFPNNIGMIKYARSTKGGAPDLRKELEALRKTTPAMPPFVVFRPKFKAFGTDLVVRFEGSARPVERELSRATVTLIYDNVGLAPGNAVPRMRSFPRNSLTYAGVCAALFALAFYFWWSDDKKRRMLGAAAVAAALFGVGFSLARGAWVAVAIAIVYLVIDGVLSRGRKLRVVVAFVAAALVLSGVYLIKYEVDPLRARAGAGGSVATRSTLYEETVEGIRGIRFLVGFGTERPRTATGATHVGARYIPLAGTHSTYLNYLFRTGVPGAIGIIALYGIAILHARAASRVHTGAERAFSTLVTAGVVAAAAHAVILSLYVEPMYTLGISLLLGIAMAPASRLSASVVPWRTRAGRAAE